MTKQDRQDLLAKWWKAVNSTRGLDKIRLK